MDNMQFKYENNSFEAPFTEEQIREAMQQTIKQFVLTGGDYESYEDGPGGLTYCDVNFEEITTMVNIILCEGAVEINLDVDSLPFAIDALFDPVEGTFEPNEGDLANVYFFKSELEQIQVIIDQGKLVDRFGQHHIRK